MEGVVFGLYTAEGVTRFAKEVENQPTESHFAKTDLTTGKEFDANVKQILTLVTCSYEWQGARNIVAAVEKLIPVEVTFVREIDIMVVRNWTNRNLIKQLQL